MGSFDIIIENFNSWDYASVEYKVHYVNDSSYFDGGTTYSIEIYANENLEPGLYYVEYSYEGNETTETTS